MKKAVVLLSAVSLTATLVAPLSVFAQESNTETGGQIPAVGATVRPAPSCEDQLQGLMRRVLGGRDLKEARGEMYKPEWDVKSNDVRLKMQERLGDMRVKSEEAIDKAMTKL